MHFERALVDGSGDKPVLRKVPLEHQTPSIESVDIGFLDPGTGKTEKRTRFSFEVTRERGFEAGEYEVEISDARSSSQIGETARVTLQGDNPIVDRRAMVFAEKKKEEGGEGSAPNPKLAEKRQLSADDPEYWAGGPTKPEEEEKPLPPPASMQEKPGGCGCRVGGTPERAGALGVAGLFIAFLARRRQNN
jgi:MYXO-CTERM domain-containing protein